MFYKQFWFRFVIAIAVDVAVELALTPFVNEVGGVHGVRFYGKMAGIITLVLFYAVDKR